MDDVASVEGGVGAESDKSLLQIDVIFFGGLCTFEVLGALETLDTLKVFEPSKTFEPFEGFKVFGLFGS